MENNKAKRIMYAPSMARSRQFEARPHLVRLLTFKVKRFAQTSPLDQSAKGGFGQVKYM